MNSIFLPDNIFSRILFNKFTDELKKQTKFKSSAALSSEIRNDRNALALIPVTDILTNSGFYISKSFGIAFEGTLGNSYIYFNSKERKVSEVKLAGDVSTSEVILTKILFKEVYDAEVEISLSTIDKLDDSTHIITGDENFLTGRFEKGISLAEEMVEVISAPFVNYIFASGNETQLIDYNKILSEIDIDSAVIESDNKLPESSRNFIAENISKIFYKFDEQEIEGINQLIRLTYYHRLIDDMIDVKFV